MPPTAQHRRPRLAGVSGQVISIDNRRIARIAKLAGAPASKAAGVEIVYDITNEPWGVRRFFMRDPFGNIINILSH